MKETPLIILLFVIGTLVGFLILHPTPYEKLPFEPNSLEKEVRSLRDDLNQLTIVVSELDKPVIVVDGQVADETFDWNEFHNVKVTK